MYYKKSVKKTIQELNTDIKGLSKKEADNRLKTYGLNKILDDKKISKLQMLFKQFQDSMIIMLLIVSLISFVYSYITGESYTDTILIIFIVILNALMGYFQESKAEASIESLKKFSTTEILVKRDNEIFLCDSTKIVPGDIIILEAGDKIPADARVIESYSAKSDESILTGESVSVEKNSDMISSDVLINDRKNMIYSGCSITNGRLTAVVTNTGMNTELGKIASSLTDNKDVMTPLQQKTNEISKNLSIIVIIIIGLVFIYNILILHNDILDVVMLCISLMVSAVPEGLPAVISISLSLGVKEMSKNNALIRTLSSVETLGATSVICSDKTGTITKNEMTVVKVYSNNKLSSSNDKIDNNKLLLDTMVLCNDSKTIDDKIVGDPTETALVDFALKNNYELLDDKKRILDIPFDSNRKMMSTINKIDNEEYLLSKGSLESILKCCTCYEENGKIIKLDDKKRNELIQIESTLAKDALRVIGFSYKKVTIEDYKDKKNDNLLTLENDLIFIGMVGMIDPPRDNVKEAIQTCYKSGITPIMITGDSLNTALAIAKDIGLAKDDSQGIEGKELKNYSDDELVNLVKKYKVYARVSPEDKVRIVTALQKSNKIVAMTGDGVNDAPAIKLAHIGIGMGQTGTEVTKSVSDVLLLDDCFNTIVVAVKEGRRIYNNIRNVILYTLSSNFAEIFIVVIGMIFGHTVLLPIQILYIDLVTDAILSICLAFEKGSKNIMNEPPHSSSNKFFTPLMTTYVLLSSIIECILIFIVYFIALSQYGSEVAQSMAFLCLIVQEMVFAYNCRNIKEPLIKHGFFSNKYINIGYIILIAIQILIYVTPARELLHIVTIEFSQLLFIIGINLIVFIFFELIKPFITSKLKD